MSEMRHSEAYGEYPALSMSQALSGFAGTKYDIYNVLGNATPTDPKKRFYLSILVDPTKLYVEKNFLQPLADSLFYPLNVNTEDFNKSSFNRSLHCMRLFPVSPDGKIYCDKPFWVVTTHFSIPLSDKKKQTEWIIANLETILNYEPFVLMGDFNFFPDDSAELVTKMATHFVDNFVGKSVEYGTGRRIDSTFVGFPEDKFNNPDIYQFGDKAQILDRVYTGRANIFFGVENQTIDTRLFLPVTDGTVFDSNTYLIENTDGKYYDKTDKVGEHSAAGDHMPLIFNVRFDMPIVHHYIGY
jgi:hypothetical protein